MDDPSPGRSPHDLGRWGESYAAERLERTGWRVLERGFRAGHTEIDLVAAKGPVLAFVEVKTRSGTGFGHPEEAVTARKRREIEAVARTYLSQARGFSARPRFDVIGILVGPGRKVLRYNHLEDAWRVGE